MRPPDPRTVPPEVAKTAPLNFGSDQRYMVDETSGLTLKLESDVKDFMLTLDPTKGPPGGAANSATFVEMMQSGAKDKGSNR